MRCCPIRPFKRVRSLKIHSIEFCFLTHQKPKENPKSFLRGKVYIYKEVLIRKRKKDFEPKMYVYQNFHFLKIVFFCQVTQAYKVHPIKILLESVFQKVIAVKRKDIGESEKSK